MLKLMVLTISLAVILHHVYKLYLFFQPERSGILYRHAPGPCISLTDADGGSEDIEYIGDGLALVSSGLYQFWKGRILLFDFNNPTHKLIELKIVGNINTTDFEAFRPHGISSWTDPNSGMVTVMVINHSLDGDTVEVFEFKRNEQSLIQLRTIRDPKFTLINDVLATSATTFYATNSVRSAYRNELSKTIETFLLVKLGRMLYYDGSSVSVVAGGMHMPNGLNISPDKRFLFVTSIGRISSFEIDKNHGLKLKQELDMDTTPDNIYVDPVNGDLWVGAHPAALRVLLHMMEPQTTSAPSQILKMKTKDGRFEDVVEVYSNDGDELSASSVAIKYKGRMLAGSIASHPVLCDLVFVT